MIEIVCTRSGLYPNPNPPAPQPHYLKKKQDTIPPKENSSNPPHTFDNEMPLIGLGYFCKNLSRTLTRSQDILHCIVICFLIAWYPWMPETRAFLSPRGKRFGSVRFGKCHMKNFLLSQEKFPVCCHRKNFMLSQEKFPVRFSRKSISSWERRSCAPRDYDSLRQTRHFLASQNFRRVKDLKQNSNL